MKQTILVLGGTGTPGKRTTHSLKDAGFRVRVMSRDAKKAREIFRDTLEIFDGDPMDTACLEEALDGCYGVHISLPTEVEQQVAESVAKTAQRHGIERITYISGGTVAEENRWFPMVNQKFLAEKAIQAAGIPYTIICPTWMMESLPLFVVQGRASVLGKQPSPYHWVAGDDLARMISTAYGLAEAANKRFTIHGPGIAKLAQGFDSGIANILIRINRQCNTERLHFRQTSSLRLAEHNAVQIEHRAVRIPPVLGGPTQTVDDMRQWNP